MDKKFFSILALFLLGFFAQVASADEIPNLDELKKLYKRPESIPFPADNPYSKEKEDLGKKLFFDPRVSGSNIISCATCHNPGLAWGDGLAKGVGHGHKTLDRRTPTILNLAWAPKTFWDGRAGSLEEQALGPIGNTAEMNQKVESLEQEIKEIREYKMFFEKAFPEQGGAITKSNIAKAIATFERMVVSKEAPFDRFVKGDNKAISDEAKRGFALFNGKAMCMACHSGWNFSDHNFYDIGLKGKDIGRGKFDKTNPMMQHAFKTPTLRNVDHRGPYMHDGSEKTLEDVVAFYNAGPAVKRKSVSPLIRPLNLNKQEQSDLVAFMKTLTAENETAEIPVLPR